MIRDLSKADPVLIGIIGKAGTGKTAAADYLEQRHGFVQVAFAAALKTSVLEPMLEALGIDYAHLYEPSLKNVPLPGYEREQLTARKLMQLFGDAGRACAPDWWVDQLAANIGMDAEHAYTPVHDRIVVSDVRYPNEAAWVQRHGGVLVRLHRDSAEPVRAHSSEQHIDSLPADVDLVNNGPTLVGLQSLLDGVLADLRIKEVTA
jgi:hypothetical protein